VITYNYKLRASKCSHSIKDQANLYCWYIVDLSGVQT